MELAGKAAFEVIRKLKPHAKTLSVVAGPGNNAGDGYILASLAHQNQLDVRVYPLIPPEQLYGDALSAYQFFSSIGGETLSFIPNDFEGTEILVDAILGTGLNRAIEEPFFTAIQAINRYRWNCPDKQAKSRFIFSLDMPSGLNGSTGAVASLAVKADATLTFLAPKQGLYTGDGPEHAGQIFLDKLYVESPVTKSATPTSWLLTSDSFSLPKRNRGGHKGSYGHAIVLGGDIGLGGAPKIAALGAARSGAGKVTLGTRDAYANQIDCLNPEIMVQGVDTIHPLRQLLQRADVIALGPGLGQAKWGHQVFEMAINSEKPKVIDADALNFLALAPQKLESSILTPHPGEAGRLLGISTSDVQRDRFAAVEALHQKYNSIIVLKGAGTLVFCGGDVPTIIPKGNPGMASGGMGDLLTGIISGLLAQGLPLLEAAKTGAYIHGLAGDQAAKDQGEIGLLATDLLPYLPKILNGRPEPS